MSKIAHIRLVNCQIHDKTCGFSESMKQSRDGPVSKNYPRRHGCRRLQLAPGSGCLQTRAVGRCLRNGTRFAVCAPSRGRRPRRLHAQGAGRFPLSRHGQRIWQEYFTPGGKPSGAPYPAIPMHQRNSPRKLVELCIVSNFVEVFWPRKATRIPWESTSWRRCRCRTCLQSTERCWQAWGMC